MTNYTNEQLRDTMQAVVSEYGKDYKVRPAEMCSYGVLDPPYEIRPVCIVGQVLSRLDPALFSDIVKIHNHTKITIIADIYPGMLTDEQRFALNDAQRAQDSFATWGDALELFEERLNA